VCVRVCVCVCVWCVCVCVWCVCVCVNRRVREVQSWCHVKCSILVYQAS